MADDTDDTGGIDGADDNDETGGTEDTDGRDDAGTASTSGGGADRRVVTEGPFEEEVDLSRGEAADFLHDLADQLDDGTDLAVGRDDWEVQFSFGEPIEVEVELEDDDERELEIELEFEE